MGFLSSGKVQCCQIIHEKVFLVEQDVGTIAETSFPQEFCSICSTTLAVAEYIDIGQLQLLIYLFDDKSERCTNLIYAGINGMILYSLAPCSATVLASFFICSPLISGIKTVFTFTVIPALATCFIPAS